MATSILTFTSIAEIEIINMGANEWDKAAPMSYEFVVEGRGVLTDLHNINCHRRHFRNDYATKCIGHGQVSVVQLELDGVLVLGDDLYLWKQMHSIILEVWIANVAAVLHPWYRHSLPTTHLIVISLVEPVLVC